MPIIGLSDLPLHPLLYFFHRLANRRCLVSVPNTSAKHYLIISELRISDEALSRKILPWIS